MSFISESNVEDLFDIDLIVSPIEETDSSYFPRTITTCALCIQD